MVRRQFDVDPRIDRVALGGNASGLENQRLEFLAAGVLSRRGSGFAGNIFFHQGAAVVVGAGVQAELRQTPVQLYPGHLNIVDRAGQHDPRQGVNLEMLGQSGAGAGESLMKQQRVLMHEAERDKFGEASGLLLDFAQKLKLIDPVRRGFDVPVHQRGRAANAAAVRGADDLLPLFGGKFVAREHEAHVVVENFGGGAGESVEAVVAQHREIVRQRHAGEFDAIHDLHGREGVNVHVGHGGLYGAQDVAVVERRQAVRQPALNADFGCAQLPGFKRFLRHGFQAVEVAVRFARAAAEGAEFAARQSRRW